MSDQSSNHKDHARKLHEKLVAVGIPAALAAAIIGALYALAVALGIITLPGCSATYTQTPDGTLQVHASVVTPTK